MEGFDKIGLSGTIEDTGLMEKVPRGYSRRNESDQYLELHREVGGDRQRHVKRKYPVWFLEDEKLVIPPEGKFYVLRTTCYAWMSPESLNPFAFHNNSLKKSCVGYKQAKAFSARLDRIRSMRQAESDHDNDREGMIQQPRS
jgi:hypothetical protein